MAASAVPQSLVSMAETFNAFFEATKILLEKGEEMVDEVRI